MKGNNKPLLCIVGPTASGKTRLAVYLAEIIDGKSSALIQDKCIA
jgi:tRNA A37 N6-isopentenylltransferase MiaA